MKGKAGESPASARAAERGTRMPKRTTGMPAGNWILSTRVHLVLYSLLLIMTPFVLLQNFLVDLISDISRATWALGGLNVPIVPAIAGLIVLGLAIRFHRRINRRLLLVAAILVLFDAIAQEITDYYMAHNFYDLQQNWHYIAYGLFAYMAYRDLAPRGYSLARIQWLTFFIALGYSCFDEFFQMHMSSRVFDLSDTAKDLLGVIMGMTVTVVLGHSEDLLAAWKQLRGPGSRRSLSALLRNPLFVFAVLIIFDLIFLSCASLLSDAEYVFQVVWLSLSLFIPAFFALLLATRPRGRIVLLALAALVLVPLGISRIAHGNDSITRHQYGLTVYRGVPVPFFDAMIFPNGHFRLVDKKHYFNPRDIRFLRTQRADIILIGTGERGLGGQGFIDPSPVQFVFNEFLNRPSQVILLPSGEACEVFNRLKREGKNVLFVLHNTC